MCVKQSLKRVNIDDAIPRHRNDFHAVRKPPAIKDTRVLDSRDINLADSPMRFSIKNERRQSERRRFRCATREHNLFFRTGENRRNRISRRFQFTARNTARFVYR